MPYAAGTCRGCGTPCGGVRCDACNATRREQEAAQRAHRRAHGLCITCGAPVAKTKLVGSTLTGGAKRVRVPARYCRKHLDAAAARQRAAS